MFSDGRAPSSTWDALLGQVDNSRPVGGQLDPVASHVQDVTSGMRMPLEVAVNCPQEDIVGVLNWLERLTPVEYCHLCFGVSKKCRCSNVPRQTPSQALALCKMLFARFLRPNCARWFFLVFLLFAGFLVSYFVEPEMCAGLGELL